MLYSLLFLGFLHCYLSSYYPNEYSTFQNKIKDKIVVFTTFLNPYLMEFSYNTIYYFSLLQIKLKQLLKILAPYIILLKDSIHNVLVQYHLIEPKNICKNFTIIHKYTFSDNMVDVDTKRLDKPYSELQLCNFINNSDNKYNLFVFYDNLEENLMNIICKTVIPDNFNYELSNIKFMLVQLSYNNDVYTLHLKTPEHNYYIVDNVIDIYFIKYYLTQVLGKKIDTIFSYKLSIIDHNISMVEFNEKHKIVIKKNDYEVITCE